MTSTPTSPNEPLTHGRVLVVFSGLLLAMLARGARPAALIRRVSRELVPDARVTGEHQVVTP